MTDFDDFAEFEFDVTIHHVFGDVRRRHMGTENGIERIMWGIQAGTRYYMDSCQIPRQLQVVQGNGFISIAGEEFPYSPGAMFSIAGDVWNSFIRAGSATVIMQSQPEEATDRS